MSMAGISLNVEYEATSDDNKTAKLAGKKRVSSIKETIVPQEQVTAYINPRNCVNCGTCREVCPTGAIKENQRIICHGCPVCTEKPGISPQSMEALTTETSCTTTCPLGVSPQGYIGLTRAGKYDEAFNLIWNKNPLPSVCGSICHHPCEDGCKRGILVDYPIDIRGVKKYLSEEVDAPVEKYNILYDENVAIIGSGPAGLTAGHYLSLAGYKVTVFESAAEAGGMLKRGIPEFRLKRQYVDRDIAKLKEAGLDIKLDSRINQYTLEELKDKYDVIIVATGSPNSKELKIPGFRLAGVMGAMNFMEHVNHGMEVYRHLGQVFKFKDGEAVIIGGGSVAMDVARTAIRVGASKVTVVCLEEGEDVPAHPWELEEALEEGIEIIEGYNPVEFTTDVFPHLTGVKFAKVKSMGKNPEGNFEIVTDYDNVIELKADWVVEAIGQSADSWWKNQSDNNLFFTGDIASNKCSVVDAMALGRKTAIEVDAALRGRRVKNPMEEHELVMADVMEKIFPYNRRKTVRPLTPKLDIESRINNFSEVEGMYNDAEIKQEVLSCLGCGYEVVDQEKCIACGMCQVHCPMGNVITLVAKEGGVK
ncbi:Ferredoxin--NADP reductase [anaerobic digester metagenome]